MKIKQAILTWIWDENALFNESIRRINKNTRKKWRKAKPAKPKKQAQKINFENKTRLVKLAKNIDLELFHQQLGQRQNVEARTKNS